MTQHSNEFKTILITNVIYPASLLDDLKAVFERVIYAPAAPSFEKPGKDDVHPTAEEVGYPLLSFSPAEIRNQLQNGLPSLELRLLPAPDETRPELTERPCGNTFARLAVRRGGRDLGLHRPRRAQARLTDSQAQAVPG